MKYILIILIFSLLILTPPLLGQETYVLFQFKNSSGNQWKPFGDLEVQPFYKGEIKNGIPNGQGVFNYPDGRKYVGQWIDGKINGQGTYLSPLRWKYVGEFKDGKYHGKVLYF